MKGTSTAGDGPDNDSETDSEGVERSGPTIAYVDERKHRCDRVPEILSGSVAVRAFTDPSEAREAIDRTVAVLVLVNNLPDDEITKLVFTARQRSPFCHVALVAREVDELSALEAPRDEALTSPLTWKEFGIAVDSLLRRAQYLSGLQHYYKLSLSLNNRRIELGDTDPEADEQFTSIQAELEMVEGRLDSLAERFTDEEYRAVMARMRDEPEEMAERGRPATDPAIYGLPSSCPKCGLEWGEWHGSKLGHGFKRIAATVWRCTDCDSVIDNPDASHRRISGR